MEIQDSDYLPISIILPLYNKEKSILNTIASVQLQTKKNWELIVVDDGSLDRGAELVAGLTDQRVRLFKQNNCGVSAARNKGVMLASNELLVFIDADDYWFPSFLDAIASLYKDYPKAQWFATGYEIRHPRDGTFNARINGLPDSFDRGIVGNYFSIACRSDPPVWTSAMGVKRSAILQIGGFPEGISSGEDLLTWARLAVISPLAYDARVFSIFEVSGIDRVPDPEGRVFNQLTNLQKQHPLISDLSSYVGFWARIEAIKAMRNNQKFIARRCAWHAFTYGPRQWRNMYTLVLAWLPVSIRKRLDIFLRKLAS